MSEFENNSTDLGGEDDFLAAEYVLGVLGQAERTALDRRLATDAAFARLVESWQVRLSGLDGAYAEVEAPAGVLPAIEARLFAMTPDERWVTRAWNSITLWRSFTAAAALGLLALAFLASGIIGTDPKAQYVAALEPTQGGEQVLALYDGARSTVRISGFPADLPEDRVFELWFAVGQNPPVSLGLLPREGGVELALPAAQAAQLAAEADVPTAHFGISLEPLGGSPTGAPTGPVLVIGDLRRI